MISAGDAPDRPLPPLPVRVDCTAGYRGEETPRVLVFEKRRIAVRSILDRWLAPDHRYFKVEGDDGAIYIIRHCEQAMQWELTFYRRSVK